MNGFLSKLRWLTQQRRKEVELRDELEFHLEEEADEGTAAGLTEDDARLAARRGLGNRALIEEDARAAWGWIWIERVGQDVRYAGRMMRRRPGFTVAAILTLMLGIGANTAVFSLLNALLLRSLPVERPEALVRLIEQGPDPSSYRDAFTLITQDTLKRGTTALSGVIASSTPSGQPAEIEERGEKQPVFLQMVSDNYFESEPRVLGFAALLSCVTCLLFGLVPALRGTHARGAPDFRSGAGTGQQNRSWLNRGLLVSQVVMCTLLLTVAGVFLRSLQNLRGQETGYQEDRLLVADVEPPREYPEARRDQLIEELRARAAALPGVDVAAFSNLGQLSGFALEYRVGFPGHPKLDGDLALVIEQRISPGFLSAMGTPFSAGRDVAPSDDARSTPVAIVNESFARRFLPGSDPIGVRFFQEGGSRSGELMEIVGVVKDSKWVNLRDDSPAMYYRPYRQQAGSQAVRMVIRTSGDPDAPASGLSQAAQAIDRRIRLRNVVPFREIVNRTLVIERLVTHVSVAFGVLALLIAAVGLYGVLAYSVVRRRREIGVRIAVGAPPRSVEWMVLRESLVLLACGAAIGVPAAMLVTRLVSSMLFGLSPHDPGSIAAALTTLTGATVAAAYIPARRAANMDPILALREE